MPRKLSVALAIASLAAGLLLAVLHFRGALPASAFRTGFLLASLAYFVFALLGRGKAVRPAAEPEDAGRV